MEQVRKVILALCQHHFHMESHIPDSLFDRSNQERQPPLDLPKTWILM